MRNILVVDDELAVCRFFKALLEPGTCMVHCASNAEDALEMAVDIPIDAAVIDIHLGRQSGIDILRSVRKKKQDLPVIMITGDPDLETAKNSLHLGAFDYIEKPLKPEAVARAVKQALDVKMLGDEKRRLEHENRLYQEELKKKILDQTVELERNQRYLYQMEKMAAIGQIAAGVAHEINNPTGFVGSNLNIMKGYVNDMFRVISAYRAFVEKCRGSLEVTELMDDVSAVEQSVEVDYVIEDIQALIKESEEGIGRIKKIVQDLKAFAHPGMDQPVYSSINANLDMTLSVIWNELKYKVTVKKDYGDIPDIPCFPQQLSQVFANILVNAAHAIEKKGVVTIKTRDLGDRIEVAIKDTGKGIPEENLSRIFDPFFTTKDVGKGTGLGMHVAYSIIEKHQGTICVDSKVGRGTTFTIYLPVRLS